MNVTSFKVQEEEKGVFKERKIGEISFTKQSLDKKEKELKIGGLEEAKHSDDEEEDRED